MDYKFIQIDEEGYPLSNGLRVQDSEYGAELLKNISKLPERRIFTTQYEKETYIVEAFDEPLVAQMIFSAENSIWEISSPYDLKFSFSLESLFTDEWDRIHGVTEKGIPFVFSSKAQAEFFRLVDEVYIDRFEWNEKEYYFQKQFEHLTGIEHSDFWTTKYLDTANPPGWDMKQAHPILNSLLPQLKISKARILVLGCGRGHDCAFWAERGHVVTGVDFSAHAIEEAQKLYGHISNLKFVHADVFDLPQKFDGQFDIIFEHTCFCAIPPSKRNDLIKVWRNCLVENGFLLGIFFTIDSRNSPPYGGTEWEYRERLKNHFQFLYWTRLKNGSPRSLGSELVIFARKLQNQK